MKMLLLISMLMSSSALSFGFACNDGHSSGCRSDFARINSSSKRTVGTAPRTQKNDLIAPMHSSYLPTQEWDVRRYQDQHSFVWEYGSSLLELVELSNGERVLDVGCGSGELTNALFQKSASEGQAVTCIGMDADLNMVRKAREQFSDCSFVQGDVRNFVVHDQEELFDVVFSNAALHWIPAADAERAVACIAGALKPGTGRFVVEFGGQGNIAHIVRACMRVLKLPPDVVRGIWNFPSIAAYTTLLEKHGIEVTSATLFDRPTVLEDGELGMTNWLRMFGSYFFRHLATNEEREQAIRAVVEELRPVLFDGKRWTADYRRIRIVGKRVAKEANH